MGAMHSDDVKEFLTSRQVSEEEIESAYNALIKIAEAFYRDPAEPTNG